jgi:hypothetical protein
MRYNTGQTVLYAGFVLWAWGAQLETGTSTSNYQSNNKSFQCNASTPSNKCFNTLVTCQDTNNYDKGERTLYFCKSASNIPKDNPYIPSVASVSTAPTKINPTNGDRNSSPLGQRAAATIVFDDHPHSDFQVDPYLADRNYYPLDRGTFWSKWLARNPYYQNRPLRIYEGYVGQTLSQANLRSYFIDSVQGPDSTGRVQIVAKDPLKLADRQKAQVPAPSTGTLRIAINTTDTTIDINLAVLADYPAPGIVRIDDELITYTTSAIINIGGIDYVRLTGVTRATNGTIAASHDAAALVQICTQYNNQTVWTVIYDLLTTYAGIESSFIPLTDWNTEGNVWLAQFNVSAILSQPRGVGEVLGEILEQVLLYIWWDERDQEIKLRAIRPLIGNAPTFSDNANIIENTVGLTTDPKNRVSQIWVYWDQSNKAEALDKESNFKKLRIRADLEAESAEKYGESRVRKIYARWIQNDAQAINLSARLLGASFENPKILKLRVDAKDRAVWTADIVDILHRNIVDFTGSPTLERYQVLSVEEVLPGEVVQYEMQRFIFKGTRFGFYMASNAPTFAAATQQEKDGNAAWYSDANGLMSDGSSGWEYQ